ARAWQKPGKAVMQLVSLGLYAVCRAWAARGFPGAGPAFTRGAQAADAAGRAAAARKRGRIPRSVDRRAWGGAPPAERCRVAGRLRLPTAQAARTRSAAARGGRLRAPGRARRVGCR